MSATLPLERRRHERYRLSPMHTAVTARQLDGPVDQHRCGVTGHAYDISASGVRIELDEPFEPGATVEIHLGLPGDERPLVVIGRVVWLHDETDDPGPRRMAVEFDDFPAAGDRLRLRQFLGNGAFGRAA